MGKYGDLISIDLSSIVMHQDFSPIVSSITGIRSSEEVSVLLRKENFIWRVGNGELVFFWEDWWHPQGPLSCQFSRLFRICNHKSVTVKAFLQVWFLTENISALLWSKDLGSRDEGDFSAIKVIVEDITLKNAQDQLMWKPGKGRLLCEEIF